MIDAEISRDQTEPALLADLALCCVDEQQPDGAARALGWLLDLWGGGDDSVPLLAIHDVGHLLLRGRALRLCATSEVEGFEDDERSARLLWEDRVLSRWIEDDGVRAAHVLIAGMPPAARDRALAHALRLLLGPMTASLKLPRGNVARARTLAERGLLAQQATSRADLLTLAPPAWRAHALRTLRTVTVALSGPAPFDEADLWELTHFEQLPSEAARFALREIQRVVQTVGPAAPGLLARTRAEPDVAVEDPDVSTYPTGGFDGVSTRGTFENLVRSEVAYVGAGATATSSIDLFDVRFVEGELLYYTRDDSPLFEARRHVVIVLAGLEQLAHKLPALPAQTSLMLLGLVARLQRDLTEQLGPHGAQVAVVLDGGAGTALVVQETHRALLSTLLAADLAHRRLTLIAKPPPPSARGLTLTFSPAPPAATFVRGRRVWIQVGGSSWQVWRGAATAPAPVDASSPQALRALLDRVLEAT